jgi:tRNA(fMet)-specific endonuclease VapC
MEYIIDTNIVVLYSKSTDLAKKIEAKYALFSTEKNPLISVVSLGELNALSKKSNYGDTRTMHIENLIKRLFTIKINTKKIIDKYGDIDAYSQGKLKNNPLGTSARNMGKNDLWIAATASVYDLTLVTTDKDFQHLNGVFLDVIYVDLEQFK